MKGGFLAILFWPPFWNFGVGVELGSRRGVVFELGGRRGVVFELGGRRGVVFELGGSG